MRNDLDVIYVTFPPTQDRLRVYAIGDVHIGSPEFDLESVQKKIDIIKNDEYGCVVICGDIADFGLKNSKTNVYLQTMPPKEQQEFAYELFYPIKNKITACVAGNHEYRITKEVGTCPLYDLCVRWNIEDKYRENMAITKYSFGTVRGKKQQNVFIGLTTHGSTRNKHHKFTGGFDGLDFAVSGHIHSPNYSPQGRIRISQNGVAKHVPFKEIVVDANLQVGGYGVKHEYEIPPPPELQYLELQVIYDTDRNRTAHRIMNYHSIQIIKGD